MKIKPKKIEVGDVFHVNNGQSVVVIQYINAIKILVEFICESRHRVHTSAGLLRSGTVKNSYAPSVDGIGFVGEGVHKTYLDGKLSHVYQVWRNMFKRCYNAKSLESDPSYVGCYVNPEWHNFQKFAEWYCIQPREDKWQLDKDILLKGNREYGSKNCSLVPEQVNRLFVTRVKLRGELPIGVHKARNSYISQLSVYGKITYLGSIPTPELAFNAYKTRKEAYIKEMADLYKDKLRPDVYDAMYQYTIDITD